MTGLWPAGWNTDATDARGPAQASAPPPAQPLVLTVALPAALQAASDAARRTLYPEGAARAPAHLGLFRHLPGPMLTALRNDLVAVVAGTAAPLATPEPVRLKNGLLMLPVRSPGLLAVRESLADRWHGLLAPGDGATPVLHITLAGVRARPRLSSPPLPMAPWRAAGLLLWQAGGYGEACWRPLVALRFRR